MVAVSFALAATGGAGCGETLRQARPGTLEYTERARADYEKAMGSFYNRDWEEAEKRFNDVRSNYGQSQYARLAALRLADIAFEQDKLAEAISAYKAFAQSHRRDAGIPYAQYRVCRALFMQVDDSLLLPPQEEREQGPATEAYRELRNFVQEYPDSKWDREVVYMLESVSGRLVRHELYVARFYLQRDNFKAAVGRIQYGLSTYEGSGLEPEAMVMLGETYLKMNKRKEARETFERLLSTYPESPFVVPARGFLAEMDTGRGES
jgi:outer membrane protein assembly factor BamD